MLLISRVSATFQVFPCVRYASRRSLRSSGSKEPRASGSLRSLQRWRSIVPKGTRSLAAYQAFYYEVVGGGVRRRSAILHKVLPLPPHPLPSPVEIPIGDRGGFGQHRAFRGILLCLADLPPHRNVTKLIAGFPELFSDISNILLSPEPRVPWTGDFSSFACCRQLPSPAILLASQQYSPTVRSKPLPASSVPNQISVVPSAPILVQDSPGLGAVQAPGCTFQVPFLVTYAHSKNNTHIPNRPSPALRIRT
ncbi:hypothetical protein F4819DRAFT_470960, partial [Hypoxylon fuscum]